MSYLLTMNALLIYIDPMLFTQIKIFFYSGISALLLSRIILFIFQVDLGSADGHDSTRTIFCASVSFILLSKIYLYLIRTHHHQYQKIKLPLDIISLTLFIINLFFMTKFGIVALTSGDYYPSLLGWLTVLFWRG